MGIDMIRHQLQFLREDVRGRARMGAISVDYGERWSITINSACMHALVAARNAIPFADSLWDRLELDLAYILTRHAFWLNTATFIDVLTDRIARGYRLERPIAERIVREAVRYATADGVFSTNLVEASDDEFLRYILIASSLARDDEALTRDLGLGRGFLLGIKESLSSCGDSEGITSQIRYLPEIEVRLAEIMLDLAESLKHNQWAMESARLVYQLIGVSDPWASWFCQHGTDSLFDLLVEIGTAGFSGVSSQELGKIQVELPCPIDDFLQVLLDRGLLDPANASAHSGARGRRQMWQLTPFAYNLTAEAFIARFNINIQISDLRNLQEYYQAAMVRKMVAGQSDLLHELIGCAPQILTPLATRSLLDGMASLDSNENWRRMALSIVEKSASPYVRLVAVRELARRGEHAVLERIGDGDCSAIVREAAWNGFAAAHRSSWSNKQ